MKRLFKGIVAILTVFTMVFGACGAIATAETESTVDLADYEPQRVIASQVASNESALNVSWVNPKAALNAVKIYRVNGSEEEELSADSPLDTTPSKIVTYTDNALNAKAYATYKLHFDFTDGTTREVYTSGKAGERGHLALSANSPSNQIPIYAPSGFKGNIDLVTEDIGNPNSQHSVKINSNQDTDNDKYYIDFLIYGANNIANTTGANVAKPGKYRVYFEWKGTATAIVDMYVQGGTYWTWLQNAMLLNKSVSRTGQPSGTFDISEENTNPWYMFLVRLRNISAGELYIDTIYIQRLKDGTTDEWENFSVQGFDIRNDFQSDTPNPQNITCDYTTSDATLGWTVPEVRSVKNNFKETDDPLYCTYTNVYEKINGKEYLRAMLPNSGKTTDGITLKNYVTGDYIIKTHRDNALSDADFEGDGSYSGGVSVKSEKIVLDRPELSADRKLKFKARNCSENVINPTYLVAVYNNDGLLKGCYKNNTDKAIPANGGITDIEIENVEIADGDSAKLMVWDSVSNMKPYIPSKSIDVKNN